MREMSRERILIVICKLTTAHNMVDSSVESKMRKFRTNKVNRGGPVIISVVAFADSVSERSPFSCQFNKESSTLVFEAKLVRGRLARPNCL
jgi:hypothetical protein